LCTPSFIPSIGAMLLLFKKKIKQNKQTNTRLRTSIEFLHSAKGGFWNPPDPPAHRRDHILRLKIAFEPARPSKVIVFYACPELRSY
jgi:hypothetical protein